MTCQEQSPAWWRQPWLAAIVLIASLTHLYRVDQLSLRGEETRRAAIGQEMLRGGDWLVPRMQEHPVYFRPPLQNWLLALSIHLRGTPDAWAVRLPGVLAVVATALLIFAYGRRFLSPLGAFASAVSFLSMIHVLELGRLAETESLFTLLVAAALFAWHWGLTRGWSDVRLWCTAYACAALAALAKGMQAPAYLFLASAAYLLATGQWRRFLSWGHFAGLAVFAAVFGAWWFPYAWHMGIKAGWNIVVGETVMHMTPGGFAAYLKHLAVYPLKTLGCMLPWSLLLAAYAWPSFRRHLGAARPLALFCWIAPALAFPTCWLAPGSAHRYFMPLYPCFALLCGTAVQYLTDAAAPALARVNWNRFILCAGLGILLFSGFLAVGTGLEWKPWLFRQPVSELILFLAAGAVLVGLLFYARRFGAAAVGLQVTALAIFMGLVYSVPVYHSLQAKSFDFEREIEAFRKKYPPGSICSLGIIHHRLMFYYRDPLPAVPWPTQPGQAPTSFAFFCVEEQPEYRDLDALPFAWEKVEAVRCDRYVDYPTGGVLVGRILSR